MPSSEDEAPRPVKPQPRPKRRRPNNPSTGLASPPPSLTAANTSSFSSDNDLATTTAAAGSEQSTFDFFSRAKALRPALEKQAASFTKINTEEAPEAREKIPEDDDLKMIYPDEEDFDDDKNKKAETQKKNAAKGTSSTQKKRELSITPPPTFIAGPKLTWVAPTVFGASSTSTTIIDLDDDDDVEELDPELRTIAERIDNNSSIIPASILNCSPSGSFTSSFSESSTSLAASPLTVRSPSSTAIETLLQTHGENNGEQSSPQGDLQSSPLATPSLEPQRERRKMAIMMRTLRDPTINFDLSNPSVVAQLAVAEKNLVVRLFSDDHLKSIMDLYCRTKQRDIANVVFTYKNIRVFALTTPESLDFGNHAILDVWSTSMYQEHKAKMLEEQNRRHQELNAKSSLPSASSSSSSSLQPADSSQTGITADEGESQEAAEGPLYVVIRGKDTDDVRVQVKTSTTIGKIAAHYRRLKNLGADVAVRLEFDSEELDPETTVGDTEIEDDDMLTAKL